MQDQTVAPGPRIDPLAVSIPDAADALGVAASTMRTMVAEGAVPSVRIRGRRMIRTADLAAYVEGLEVA